MRKIIIAIMLILCAFGARAENTGITTSQAYVETKAAEKQDAVPANNANSVMTYDSTSDDGIGAKAIYNESSSYETQENALLTAGTANGAIQNAIDNEFTCANPPKCTLWRMAWLSQTGLPAGYTELEYIESTGAQWINTGIAPTNNIGVSVKYAFTTLSAYSNIFGSHTPHYYLSINSTGTYMLASYGPSSSNVVLSIPIADVVAGQPYDFNINYYNSGMVEWVGMKSANLAPKSFSSDKASINMFAVYMVESGGNGALASASRIYYMRITDGNTLVRDFIPARYDATGALGMYDLVTNTFYTNDGRGTFIAGPVASFIPQNQ